MAGKMLSPAQATWLKSRSAVKNTIGTVKSLTKTESNSPAVPLFNTLKAVVQIAVAESDRAKRVKIAKKLMQVGMAPKQIMGIVGNQAVKAMKPNPADRQKAMGIDG